MPATYTGPQTTYVPNFEASGRLTSNFSRNPKSFALNSYIQLQPVKQMTGFYRKRTVEEAGRIIDTGLSNFIWPDNADMPRGMSHESDQYLQYLCKRYAYREQLGFQATEQSEYDIFAEYEAQLAQQAMTARTVKVLNLLTTAGNWSSAHNSDVQGDLITDTTGKWDASTTARQDIKRSLTYAAEEILDSTLAGVELNDLVLIISTSAARKISISQEIVDHIKGSPEALAQVRGELPGNNAIYGLPDKLYGFPVIIEKTRYVTSRKGATRSVSQAMPATSALMVSRPGGLVGVAGAPTFSTCVLFVYEKDGGDLQVIREQDNWNKYTKLAVIDNNDVELVADESGFLFTNAVAA